MATRPALIAQISDLHITRPGVLAYGHVDTAAALKETIDTLNRMSPRPDLVVISGDIADSALPEENMSTRRNCLTPCKHRSHSFREIMIAGHRCVASFPIPATERQTAR